MYNLYVKRELENNDFLITYAEKGKFKNFNNIPVLILFNGETISNRNNEITNFSFSKTDFIFKDYKTNTITETKTQEISTNELILCINQIYNLKIFETNKKIINCSKKNIKNILKELYKRIIIPFYIPLLILTSFFLILNSKESSKYKKIKFLTFFLGLLIIIFSETTIRFITNNIYFNFKLLIIPFILILIFYFFLIVRINYSTKKIMKVYIKFLAKLFTKNIIYVSGILFCLVIIINLLGELEFFKEIDVDNYFPLILTMLNAPSMMFELFPFIFLISTQIFFINLFNNNQINIFKYSGLKILKFFLF